MWDDGLKRRFRRGKFVGGVGEVLWDDGLVVGGGEESDHFAQVGGEGETGMDGGGFDEVGFVLEDAEAKSDGGLVVGQGFRHKGYCKTGAVVSQCRLWTWIR